jgi:uncharacterized protein (DUF58 family)
MKPGRRERWRRWLFPPIGGRIRERRGLAQRWLPFGAWFHYLLAAWPTRRLFIWAGVVVAPLAGLYLSGVGIAASPLVFALSVSAVAAIVCGGLRRPSLRVVSEIPARVEAGRPFSIRYTVSNTGHRTLVDLAVETLRYPGWFELRIGSALLPVIAPESRCTATGQGAALRRGCYRLPPLRCDTDFPSGLWRWGRTDWTERRLTVYPAYARLASLDMPDGARNRLDVQAARQLTRSALEFHGCREFRTGDSLKHVHARSSARLGYPVVKEFQAEGRGRTAILVDTWRRSPSPELGLRPDPVIEAVLSLAASVTDCLARSDRVLELLVAGPGLYRFVSAGRIGYLEGVLDILAAVEPRTSDTLPQLAPVLVEEIQAIESVCLILARWDRARADFLRELTARGIGVKVILVTRFHHGRIRNLPPGVIRLASRSVLRGEVSAL